MSKPEPVEATQDLRPIRQPASDETAHDAPAVLVDEKWRAWVFYEQDPADSRQPGHQAIASRATP